jgi:hypothetical protein
MLLAELILYRIAGYIERLTALHSAGSADVSSAFVS